VARHLAWHMARLGIDTSGGPPLEAVVLAQRERCKTLREMAERSRYFYEEPPGYEEKAAAKHLTGESAPVLEALHERLAALGEWTPEAIHTQAVLPVSEALGLKLGKVAQPLRVALTGGTVSPPIDQTVALVGRERTLARIARALEHIRAGG